MRLLLEHRARIIGQQTATQRPRLRSNGAGYAVTRRTEYPRRVGLRLLPKNAQGKPAYSPLGRLAASAMGLRSKYINRVLSRSSFGLRKRKPFFE